MSLAKPSLSQKSPTASLRDPNTAVVQYVPKSVLPDGIDFIPGIRLEEHVDAPGTFRVEIPRNTWDLPRVHTFGYAVPSFHFSPRYSNEEARIPSEWRLYPHQKEAVNAFFEKRQMLLGDVMGLGKTRTSIASLELARRRYGRENQPVLIVAPKFLRATWERELAALLGDDFNPETDFCAVEGRDYRAEKGYKKSAKWIFVHYEILHPWWSFLYTKRPFGCIVDEVHLCKGGSKTLRGKGLELMTSALPWKMLLSGSPILNRPGEFYNILRLIQNPWSFGAPTDFRIRYAGAVKADYGYVDRHPTNVKELEQRLTTCFLRRTLDDANVKLPPLTRTNLVVDLDKGDLDKYKDLLGGLSPETILDAFERGLGGDKTLKWLSALRKLTTKAKLGVVLDDLEALTEQGEKAVVFVWMKETADKLETLLRASDIDSRVVHGDVPQDERNARISAFQDYESGPQVLIATYGALSVGVTLHRARTVYLVDLEWVPATMLQAEARVYRIGQSRAVQSKWVVAAGTLDPVIAAKIQSKSEWATALVGDSDAEDLASHLSDGTKTVRDSLRNDIDSYLSLLRRT